MTQQFMTVEELAGYLGIAKGTIYSWRHVHFGPPSYKFGGVIKYKLADVDAWIDSNREGEEVAS